MANIKIKANDVTQRMASQLITPVYDTLTPVNIINTNTLLNRLNLWPINEDWRSLDHTFTISNLRQTFLYLQVHSSTVHAFPDLFMRA